MSTPSAAREELDELDERTSLVLPLEGSQPMFLSFFGRKGSGKSVLATIYARSWPYDGLIVNRTKDVDPEHAWSRPWPAPFTKIGERAAGRPVLATTWPQRPEDTEHVMWNLRPTAGDEFFREKADAAMAAMARAGDRDHHPGADPRLLFVDEAGLQLQNPVLPGADDVLATGRHSGVWCLFCGPRPVDVDPLVLAQSDWVFVFHVPAVHDVNRIARTCGVVEADLRDLISSLPEHGFIRIDTTTHTIATYPPIPL